jgi:hypothetical protein
LLARTSAVSPRSRAAARLRLDRPVRQATLPGPLMPQLMQSKSTSQKSLQNRYVNGME